MNEFWGCTNTAACLNQQSTLNEMSLWSIQGKAPTSLDPNGQPQAHASLSTGPSVFYLYSLFFSDCLLAFGHILVLADVPPQPASTFIHARFLWVFSQFRLSNYHQFASDCRIFISNSHPSFWSSEQFLFLPLYWTGATQSAVSGPQQWSVNCWYCSRTRWV